MLMKGNSFESEKDKSRVIASYREGLFEKSVLILEHTTLGHVGIGSTEQFCNNVKLLYDTE